MFGDLCYPYEGTAPFDTGRFCRLFTAARSHGYAVVASNYVTAVPLRPGKDACRASEVPLRDEGAAAAVDLVSSMTAAWSSRLTKSHRASGAKRKRADDALEPSSSASSMPTNSLSGTAVRKASTFTQLSRITVSVPQGRAANEVYPGHPVLSTYDIVAIAPGDAEALRAVVTSGVADIITLDMSSGRLPFSLRADLIKAVLASGAVFELEYAPVIRDPNMRRFFIANAAALTRLTRGKGILLTSGAKHALEVRNPNDAAAIASLGDIPVDRALAALGKAVAQVLVHAEARHARGRVAGSGAASSSSSSAAAAAATGASLPFAVVHGPKGSAPQPVPSPSGSGTVGAMSGIHGASAGSGPVKRPVLAGLLSRGVVQKTG